MPLFDKKLKGETIINKFRNRSFRVADHAVKRLKERYGEKYCDGKKIKNMSVGRVRTIILNQVKHNLVKKKKANITSFYVETTLFSFIVVRGYRNEIVTALPGENHYNGDSGLSCTLGETSEVLRQLRKAM